MVIVWTQIHRSLRIPRNGRSQRGKKITSNKLLYYPIKRGKSITANEALTRMRSSRMRTGRSLPVCRSLLPGGRGVSAPGWGVCSGGLVCFPGGCLLWGCLLQGVSAPGGGSSGDVCSWGDVCSQECLLPGGVCSGGWYPSQHALRQTAPLWTESQTPVKTLPWPNFVDSVLFSSG